MCVHVILDLLWEWAANWKKRSHLSRSGNYKWTLVSHISGSLSYVVAITWHPILLLSWCEHGVPPQRVFTAVSIAIWSQACLMLFFFAVPRWCDHVWQISHWWFLWWLQQNVSRHEDVDAMWIIMMMVIPRWLYVSWEPTCTVQCSARGSTWLKSRKMPLQGQRSFR